jgi:hypothetical protein
LNGFLGKYKPYDLACLCYTAVLTILIAVFRGASGVASIYLAVPACLFFSVLLIVHLWGDSRRGWRALVRRAYPFLLFAISYELTGSLVHLIHPGFFDYQITAMEKSILGGNPTILLQSISVPVLNELFYAGYFSYFLIILVMGLYLYLNRKYNEFEKYVTAVATGYFISYLIFILYPVEGPRYALAGQYHMRPEGFLFVPICNFIISSGGLHGGCMPSSHVAIAVISLLTARRYARKLYPYYLVFAILLTIGTVWGRYHYASDAVAGIILGLFSYYFTVGIADMKKVSVELAGS